MLGVIGPQRDSNGKRSARSPACRIDDGGMRSPAALRAGPSADVAVAPADQGVAGQPPERLGERWAGRAVAHLEREPRRLARRDVGRPGVDDGEVDRDAARLRLRRARRSGRPAGDRPRTRRGSPPRLARSAGAAGSPARPRPRRPAHDDRPSHRPGHTGDGRPVRHARSGHVLAARPAGRLVEQGVLVEVGVGAEPLGRRAVAEDRPDRDARRPRARSRSIARTVRWK